MRKPTWLLALLSRWDESCSSPRPLLDADEVAVLLLLLQRGRLTAEDLAAQRCSRAAVAELRALGGTVDAQTAAYERGAAVQANLSNAQSKAA
ncbi:MAG: hypothetical protein QM765_21055 [Myxococcales bacterium]